MSGGRHEEAPNMARMQCRTSLKSAASRSRANDPRAPQRGVLVRPLEELQSAMSPRLYPDSPRGGAQMRHDRLIPAPPPAPTDLPPPHEGAAAFRIDLSYPTRLSEDEFPGPTSRIVKVKERAGTAHTAYLQSRQAAREIKNKRPDAHIIILLRNPGGHGAFLAQRTAVRDDRGHPGF